MDDKKRTKILAAALGVVVVVFFGKSTVTNWVMKPITDLRNKLKSAESENERLTADMNRLTVAKRNIDDWKDMSLPPDVDDAQRVYREWLFDVTRQCGFSGSGFEVTPGARSVQKEFTTVAVEVKKAETDLQGLAKFLYLFDQAKLLHKISNLKIDSPGVQGNPRLQVSFTAEGMTVTGTAEHSELLPRARLTGALSDSATEMPALSPETFPISEPFEPFAVRIERELVQVTAATEQTWTIQRGMAGTKAASHEQHTIAELFPVLWDRAERKLEDYAAFLAQSPFVIPSPPKTWNPRLAGVSEKTIRPGETVRFSARAEGMNPEVGEPVFSLEEASEGMAIDAKSGEFSWTPADDVKPGSYTATVLLTQTNNPDVKLSSKLEITIEQPNSAPELTLPKSALVVIGREFTLTATAKDDSSGPLKYSLGSGTPEGLVIDGEKGLLKWTPPRSFTPGKYDVEVKVSDSGDQPKSTAARIQLDVQDDHASLTLMTGAITKNGEWRVWFRDKGTGKTQELKVGEFIRVSDIDAEIISITNAAVTLRDTAGLWKVQIGKTLRDRKLIEPAPPASATPAPAATEPAAIDTANSEPPATEPPATEPPATEPPATEPPATEPPATEPPATEPPATEPPATEPPATEPPATEPPEATAASM